MQSKEKTYVCPFPGCTSAFNRPYRLALHRLGHVNIKPFPCPEENCSKAYTSKSHLDRHVKSVHRQTELDILYCCPKCAKTYANRQNLKRHIKQSHTDNKKTYKCDYCSTLFKKKHQVKAHMYQHTGIKAFGCSLCHKEYISPADKNKHMKSHKTYSCTQCDSKFNKWTDMLSHRKNHQSSVFICDDCGKKFKDRSLIVRHVKKHIPVTAVPVYFCPYENCQSQYSRTSNLKQHILVKHEGQKFSCSVCKAQLSTKAKLNAHIKGHTKPEVILKIPKTKQNGRKTRKDLNSMKVTTALKLAGIVHEDVEDANTFMQISNGCSADSNNLYNDLDET